MKRFFSTMIAAATAITVASCTSGERGADPPGGDHGLILTFSAPTARESNTRQLTPANEEKINNLWVLVFNSDGTAGVDDGDELEAILQATDLTPSGANTTAKVILPRSIYTPSNTYLRFVVLANMGVNFLDAGEPGNSLTIGDKYYDSATPANSVVDKLKKSYSVSIDELGAGKSGNFPMWGELADQQIASNTTVLASTVQMKRAFARVDVGVGARTGNDPNTYAWSNANQNAVHFKLTGVQIYRPTDHYGLIGNVATPAVPVIPHGSIQSGATLTYFSFTPQAGENWVTRSIYVPEANVRLGGTEYDAKREDRMAIIVKGIYDENTDNTFDEAESYYRLDFIKGGGLIDVVRNRVYSFSITSVASEGAGDPEEAYGSRDVKMTVDVQDWDNVTMNDIEQLL